MKTLNKMIDEVLRISLTNKTTTDNSSHYRDKTKSDYENEIFKFLSDTVSTREIYGISNNMIMDLINYCMSKKGLCIFPYNWKEYNSYTESRNAYPLILDYCLFIIRQNKLGLDNNELIDWVSLLSDTKLHTQIHSLVPYHHPFDDLDVYEMKEELKSALDVRQFISDNFINIGMGKSGIVNGIHDMYNAYHLWNENKDDFCLFEEVINHCGFKRNNNMYYSFDFTPDGNMLFKYILPVTKF